VALSWTAPVSNGGAAITDYVVEYSIDAGMSWATFADGVSAAHSTIVTGLAGGIPHLFRVAAVNVAGPGAYGISAPVTPVTVAGAPTGVYGVPGNREVVISWTAPASNGGAAITDYAVQFSSNGGTSWTTFADGVSTSLSATVTGLTNGTAYVFRVAAVNAVGTGTYTQSTPVTPRTVAGAPTAVSAVAGNAQAVVSWVAPASNGGATITDYVVEYSSNGGTSWTMFADGTSTTNSVTVTGLVNGTPYLFRVAAINVAGTGSYGQASTTVTPRTVPSAPAGVAGTPMNGQVALTWTAPFNGGAPITDYVVRYSSNGGTSWTTFADGTSTATTATVTGLTNGTSYLFQVAAVNTVGSGAFARSAAVTPRTVPFAPQNLVATAGNGLAVLRWGAPASNGGAAISDYIIAYSADGGTTYTQFFDAISTATSVTVTGLTNLTNYLFRVSAVNAAGAGAFAQSASVRPYIPAAAPSGLAAAIGNGRITLTWTAPVTNQQIVDYRVQYRLDVVGSAWQTFGDGVSTTPQAVVTGLANGSRYLFRVAVITNFGIGFYTDGTLGAVPAAPPTMAPSGVQGTGRSGVITLNWIAASSTPQAPVTSYVIQYRANTTSAQWVTLPLVVGNQTNATIRTLTSRLGYRFRVAAVNAAGLGPWSAESALIRPY
jgi:titin